MHEIRQYSFMVSQTGNFWTFILVYCRTLWIGSNSFPFYTKFYKYRKEINFLVHISYNIGNKYSKNVEKIRKWIRISRAFSPKADGKFTGTFLIKKI